jgi:hypothetical protein
MKARVGVFFFQLTYTHIGASIALNQQGTEKSLRATEAVEGD